MRNFVYLIGSANDFASVEDLHSGWQAREENNFYDFNASAYDVSISTESRVEGCESLEDIAHLIGRGLAMGSGWCLDDAWGILVEV